MTHALQIGSVRADAAARFGHELIRAMTKRGIGRDPLMAATEIGSSAAFTRWRQGKNLPTFATAVRLADALRWPKLAEVVREARTLTCIVCGERFLHEGGNPERVRFCGTVCQGYEADRQRDGFGRVVPAVVELQLGRHRAAVHRMCWECEPEGVCRTADCPLRRVSPLPLIERTRTQEARPAAGPWGSATNAAATSQGIREAWASDPTRRSRQSEARRAWWAALTPAARAEQIDRIKAGRHPGSTTGGAMADR